MIEFKCPHCKTILHIPEEFIGSTGTCKNCHNSITIDLKPANTPGNGRNAALPMGRPTLVVFRVEVTGPASRKDSIIELAAIKFDSMGQQLDTFWSLANPDESIPEKIVERTNITNDMVAQSPFSFEVVKDWFDWMGPNAILFTDHAHFHSKFICASLLREDMVSPEAKVIDVIHWAEDLEVPAQEYKLHPLLQAIGYSGPAAHRATDSCQGLLAIVQHLLKIELGRLPHQEQEEVGVLGKLLGRKSAAEVDERIFVKLNSIATTLDEMCGPNFYAKEKFEQRKRVRERSRNAETDPETLLVIHIPEWYREKKRLLQESEQSAALSDDEGSDIGPEDTPWTEVLMAATESEDSEEQRKYLMKAVSLGARDPWPYERLTAFFIRTRDYQSAQQVCQKYFEGETWKLPMHAESSLKLLQRMEKLERKLAGVS
ncbi:MAG: exonuclease domain-containing protein [Candidatus Hydrogenedentes bacterium]|nr:exonuclease domain-containing protein [Candidatus Hydrogenedentota bacterium]